MDCRPISVHIITLVLLALLIVPTSGAERSEGLEIVDIDHFIVKRVVFSEGERLNIEAEVHAEGLPVSVMLIKGDDAYDGWRESDNISISDIKEGKNVTNMNTTFKVVENFSRMNVTDFFERMEIGIKDTYYLVVALHRHSGMSREDVLEGGSTVEYRVEWSIEKREVPFWLIIPAFIFLVLGAILIGYYFWSSRRPVDEGPRRTPIETAGKRAPPFR